MKKILILALVVFGFGSCKFATLKAQSEPIIQMNAAAPFEVRPKPKAVTKSKSKTRIKSHKKHHKNLQIKLITIKIQKSHVDIDKMLEYNNFSEADNLITKALNKNPKDIEARSLWVVSMAKQYKLDPAQKELDSLLKSHPKNADLHYAQGIVDYKRTTSSNMVYINNTQKLMNDALKEFKTAIALNKEDYRAYNAAGVIDLYLGNPKEARDFFKKAVEISPNYSTAIDNLGTMDFADGKLDNAVKKFNKALFYNSKNATAMCHLAQVAEQKQDYSTALSYLNNAIAINPNSYATYNLIGEIYQKQGNGAAAINAFKKAVMLKPEFSQPYTNLAEVYEQRGDNEFAIEQLKTAVSVSPTTSVSFYDAELQIADLSLACGKYDQAIENYSVLVGVKDYNDYALKGLANAYYEQAQNASSQALLGSNQQLLKAYDCINKAVGANSKDLGLHLAKLKLARITNQPTPSEKVLKDIVQKSDGDLANTVAKGEAYLGLYDYQNAKKTFDAAATLTKNSQEDLALAEVLIYQKQFDSAEKVLRNLLMKNSASATTPADMQTQQAISDLDYITKSKKYADTSFKTAQYYLKTFNKNVAIEYLSNSLAVNPNNPDAQIILAKLLETQHDRQGALSHYKAYLGLETNPANKWLVEQKIKRLSK